MSYSLSVTVNQEEGEPKKAISRSVYQEGLNEIEAFARIRDEMNIWEASVHRPNDNIEIALYHHRDG